MTRHAYEPIEAVSSKERSQTPYDRYAALFEMQSHLDKVAEMEIDDIILSVSNKDKSNYLARKAAHYDTRAAMRAAQFDTSTEKAQEYVAVSPVYLKSLSVACQVAAISYGPAFNAVAEAINSSTNYVEKMSSSRLEILNHDAQKLNDLVGDHSRGIQTADSDLEKTAQMIDRLNQNQRQLMNTLVGG